MSAWCGWCREEFEPVEYRPASIDELNFCSDYCEEAQAEADQAYTEARYGGAPVW